MTQQLEAAGLTVASLTMADSRPPGATEREYTDIQVLLKLIDLFEMKGHQLGDDGSDVEYIGTI
ncbi:hypothetical protein P4S72_13805 [Vibrio sp. PP-XX7]